MTPQITMSFGAKDSTELETANSIWLGFWVQLPDAAAVSSYRRFLEDYASEQVALGRFQRSRYQVVRPDGLAAKTSTWCRRT